MTYDLKDTTAVITGGANGIGASTARLMLASGAKVAILDIDDVAGQAFADDAGDGAAYWHCDVTNREQILEVYRAVHDWAGGPTQSLINTTAYEPGSRRRTPNAEATTEDFERAFRVNLLGTVYTNQAAYRSMREAGWGRIINFTSHVAIRGLPASGPYASTKSAVGGWTRSVALEWGQYAITANAIAPTAQTQRVAAYQATLSTPEDKAAYETWKAAFPMWQGTEGDFGHGDPDRHLAPVIAFVASRASAWVTGQTIAVDGGLMFLGS